MCLLPYNRTKKVKREDKKDAQDTSISKYLNFYTSSLKYSTSLLSGYSNIAALWYPNFLPWGIIKEEDQMQIRMHMNIQWHW